MRDYSPTEILVTDPLGRRLGKDPITDTVYSEIPDGTYTKEGVIVTSDEPLDSSDAHEIKVIDIPEPIEGDYDIKVIGTDAGYYVVEVLVGHEDGQSKNITQVSNIKINDIQEFGLSYSEETIEEIELRRIVDIDIKPGDDPNSINLKSRGVIPVAVLADEFFDAEDIIINSVIFAGADSLRGNLEDVDDDGDLDLMLHFKTQGLEIGPDDVEAVLTGELNDGTLIKGTDFVRIVSKKK